MEQQQQQEKLPHNPNRFAEFQEMFTNSGELFGFVLPTGEEFTFDEYFGWYDEYGNYYNKDGQPSQPPQQNAPQPQIQQQPQPQQNLQSTNNQQEEVKLGENQQNQQQNEQSKVGEEGANNEDYEEEEYKEPDPERFNDYHQLFDLEEKLIGFELLTGERFYYDAYGGWYDEYGNYYDKTGQPTLPYFDEEELDEQLEDEKYQKYYDNYYDPLLDQYYDDEDEPEKNNQINNEEQIEEIMTQEKMKEVIQNFSNDYKIVIEMENLDYKVTVKDVQQFFAHNLDPKVLNEFEVEIDSNKEGRIYVNDKNLALEFIKNDKKKMITAEQNQRRIYLSVYTIEDLVQDRFDLESIKKGAISVKKQKYVLSTEDQKKIQELLKGREQKFENKQQQINNMSGQLSDQNKTQEQQQKQVSQQQGPQKKEEQQVQQQIQVQEQKPQAKQEKSQEQIIKEMLDARNKKK